MLAVLLACAFVSRQFWGVVADWLGCLSALVLGSASQAIGLLLFPLSIAWVGCSLSLRHSGAGSADLFQTTRPRFVSWSLRARQAGARRVCNSLLRGGMAAGTWLAGWMFDISPDYRYAFAIGVAFNLANLAILGALTLRLFWFRQSGFNPHWRADSPRFGGYGERTPLATAPPCKEPRLCVGERMDPCQIKCPRTETGIDQDSRSSFPVKPFCHWFGASVRISQRGRGEVAANIGTRWTEVPPKNPSYQEAWLNSQTRHCRNSIARHHARLSTRQEDGRRLDQKPPPTRLSGLPTPS
jgi:hypothetical protein